MSSAVAAVAQRFSEQSLPLMNLAMFACLQLLDVLTTLVGLRLGANELSPVVRHLIEFGPVAGLAASKLLAILLAGACLWLRRPRVILWINWWYAGLVLWNLAVISLELHLH